MLTPQREEKTCSTWCECRVFTSKKCAGWSEPAGDSRGLSTTMGLRQPAPTTILGWRWPASPPCCWACCSYLHQEQAQQEESFAAQKTWKLYHGSLKMWLFSHSRANKQGCLSPDFSNQALCSAIWQLFKTGSTWEVLTGIPNARLWLQNITWNLSPDTIERHLTLLDNLALLLTAPAILWLLPVQSLFWDKRIFSITFLLLL